MKIIDLSTGGSPRASGDGDSTGAAKGATGRESGPLGRIDRLDPRRAVAVQGIDGQRAAGSARESNDEAGSRTSFITLVAGSVASVIVSAHAPDEAPREIAAGDPAEYDCPRKDSGQMREGRRTRARRRRQGSEVSSRYPSFLPPVGRRTVHIFGGSRSSVNFRGRAVAGTCPRASVRSSFTVPTCPTPPSPSFAFSAGSATNPTGRTPRIGTGATAQIVNALRNASRAASGSPAAKASIATGPRYPMSFSARAMAGKLISPVPGSQRPGTSATWTLADPGQAPAAPSDEVALPELRVIEVEIDPQLVPVDRRDQCKHVGRGTERAARMVGRVQVLEREGHAHFRPEIGDTLERVAGLQPHRAGDGHGRNKRNPAVAQSGSVQIEPRNSEALADFCGLPCGGKELRRALVVGETPAQVAVDDREVGAGAFQRIQIVSRPVPETDAKSKLRQAAHAPFDGLVRPEHFGACRKSERLRHRRQTSMESRPSRTFARRVRRFSHAGADSMRRPWIFAKRQGVRGPIDHPSRGRTSWAKRSITSSAMSTLSGT